MMRRDASLVPLSHQHHNGLALCVLTDRELAGDAGAANLARLVRRLIDRYEVELTNHFSVEEEILFPACPRGLASLVDRLTGEHREIERLIERLRASPSAGAVTEFTALLRRHIRCEENELFERLQELLDSETLAQLGRKIDANVVRVRL